MLFLICKIYPIIMVDAPVEHGLMYKETTTYSLSDRAIEDP